MTAGMVLSMARPRRRAARGRQSPRTGVNDRAMADDIDKRALCNALGFAELSPAIEQVLQEAGLSTPRKQRISLAKENPVRALLEARFLRVCARGSCQRAAASELAAQPGRQRAAATSAEHCDLCGGSVIHTELQQMADACARAGWTRLCIVGGSPNAHTRLRGELESRLQLRLVDGTRSRSLREARADLAWAHCCVVWGPTQLKHKVSNLYTGPNCATVKRRGLEDMARHVTQRAAAAVAAVATSE